MPKLIIPKSENYAYERPRLVSSEGEEIWSFSTGEPVELFIGNKWLLFRWEVGSRGWYVTDNHVSFIPLKMEARCVE
jgi:uncharacterized protein YqjF (DUF2071 family)